MQHKYSMFFLGATLAFGLAISAYIIGQAAIKATKDRTTIRVKGSSMRLVESNFAHWSGEYTVTNRDQKNGLDKLDKTREIVKIAHALGASVEGEIGHVGLAETNDGAQTDSYTTPEEAKRFVEATGVDALAVAIGTAHGAYKMKPKLDINRLAEIRATIDTPIVLHGGSGLSDDDFRNTIKNGVAKMNIFTDLCKAGERAMKKGLEEGKSYLEIRDMKVAEIKKAAMEKMRLFGSENRVK